MASRKLLGCAVLCCGLLTVHSAAFAGEDQPAAKPAPTAPSRWVFTLVDDGVLTGVIVSKSPAQWVLRLDNGKELAVARERIRQVRPAPPIEGDGNKEHREDDKGPHTPPPPPQSDKPHGDKPQGDKPRDGAPPPPKADKPADGEGKPVTVHLKDGKTIKGKLEKRDGDRGWVRTENGELVEIRKDQIKSIE